LAKENPLPDSHCARERDMVFVLELTNRPQVLQLWVRLNPIDSFQDIYDIKLIGDILNVNQGTKALDGAFNCGFSLDRFDINDGEIFSTHRTVVLNHTYYGGTPTHYKVGYDPALLDAEWVTYTALPDFLLEIIGLNTLYFQLKTADEESAILSDQIGWHGYSIWTVGEDNGSFNPINTTMIDSLSEDRTIEITTLEIEETFEQINPTVTETVAPEET
jgi:hypothetical protein